MGSNNVDLVKKLLRAIDNTDVTELTYEEEGIKIKLCRGSGHPNSHAMMPSNPVVFPAPMVVSSNPVVITKVAEDLPQESPVTPNKYVTVTCPFVGTFYRSPAPNAPSFVKEGQEVRPGEVLCIVEAMKLMNEIECERHVRVAKILVENGSPVDFGQELFLLEPLS